MEVSEIGPAIRAARVAAGMTQADVAEPLGIRQSAVGNYERGISIPPATTLCALAEVLPALPLAEILEAEHRHQAEVRKRMAEPP